MSLGNVWLSQVIKLKVFMRQTSAYKQSLVLLFSYHVVIRIVLKTEVFRCHSEQLC